MPIVSSSALIAAPAPAALFLPLAALFGVGLDRLCGEPRRWHPLVGFGVLAGAVERRLNVGGTRRLRGLLAWSLLVLPAFVLAAWSIPSGVPGWLLHVLLLYLALGGRSLGEHRVGALCLGMKDRPWRHVIVPFDQRRQRAAAHHGFSKQRPDRIGDRAAMRVDQQQVTE